MTDTIECYAAFEERGQLRPWTYTARRLQSNEVNIKVHCCGICGRFDYGISISDSISDLHQIDDGWKGTTYPICPGHEVVGEVVQIGDAVKNLKVGDRVGVGAQRDSCGNCRYCNSNQEQLCTGV